MFNQLLESKPHKKRSPGSTVFSIVFHSALIGAAAWATANAAIDNHEKKEEKIQFVDVKPKEEPPPPKKMEAPAPPKDVTVAPPPPKGFQVLPQPVDIPKVIPDVDLSKRVTNEADFSGKGVAGGVAKGVVGGTGPVGSDNTTYFEFQVEKQAQAAGGVTPNYPETMRSAGVEGEVRAQFVVDTTGRAVPGSLKILSSSNELFSAAVRSALPRMKFYPAEVGGRKVRQLVEQPFTFTLNR
jgi:protein TonB